MNNGSDSGSSAPPRNLKFAPKIPVRKQPKPVIVKKELPASKDDTVDKELLAKLSNAKYQDDFGRRFKTEKKGIPAQVTFGYGNTSIQARSFGPHKAEPKYEDDSNQPQIKEYVEPFDYIRTYYPVTLPWRRPYSGNPDVLDRLEFGEGGSAHLPIDENQVNAAHELGFMETCDEPKMIFLQFPTRLPIAPSHMKLPDEQKGREGKSGHASLDGEKGPGSKTGNAPPDNGKARENKGGNAPKTAFCKLKDLPAGFMGKLLVYRSGKVKMKLGDVLFDISPGADHRCAEEVVAVNAKERRYCVLGELSKHAVVVPDVDALLNDLDDP